MNISYRIRFLCAGISVVLLFLAVSAFGAAAPSARTPGRVRGRTERRYVFMKLSGPMPERLPVLYLFEPKYKTLRQVLDVLDKVRKDESVTGVMIYLGSPQIGWARAQELRTALNACKLSGKRVICFMEGGGNQEYYIGSVADRLCVLPTSGIALIGLRAEIMFYRGLMDKFGVKAQFVQVGKYKGASEPFLRDGMSPPFREAMESLIDDYYEQLVKGIASGRDLKADIVKALIDRGPFTAIQARDAGLVDDALYYDEFLERIRVEAPGPLRIDRKYAAKRMRRTQITSPQQLLNIFLGMAKPQKITIPPSGNNIALIYAMGPIMGGNGDENLFGEQVTSVGKIVGAIRIARRHSGIKAVVLRISSPGGSAVASDIIWHEIVRTNKVKPVIVSLSDVAASGGYYLAVAGRVIVAQPGTLTGSIGVVGGKVNLKGLYDKLGISVAVVERGRNAGQYSSITDFSEEQRERTRSMMEQTYRDFLQRVAAGRKKTVEEIEKIAQGRVWSGNRAAKVGLVDRIGGLNLALDIARKEANIAAGKPINVIELPPSRNIFQMIMSSNPFGVSAPLYRIADELKPIGLTVPIGAKALLGLLKTENVVLMAPFTINVR